MRGCTKCREHKDDAQFGHPSICKECIKLYYRDKEGLASSLFNGQISRSGRKGEEFKLPTYSKEELRDWLFSLPEYHVLYDNWKRLDFQTEARPSIDRIKDHIGYTMSNIRLVTWAVNHAKENSNKEISIYQLDKRTEEVLEEYKSISEASIITGINLSNIARAAKGFRASAGGFKWKFS